MEVTQKEFQKMEINKVALPVQSIWSSSGQFEKQFVKGKLRNTLNISARLPSPSTLPPPLGSTSGSFRTHPHAWFALSSIILKEFS